MDRPKKQHQPPLTRDVILDAAQKIFVERGFSDTSMSRIAKEANVTKSLIHHHFGSKEQLWREVKNRRFEDYFATQKERLRTAGIGVEGLKEAIVRLFDVLRDEPDTMRLICWHLLETTELERHEEERELTALGLARIREAQEIGIIRPDIDPGYLLVSFFCLVFHWFMARHEYLRWIEKDPSSESTHQEYLDNMLKIFFEGVLPR